MIKWTVQVKFAYKVTRRSSTVLQCHWFAPLDSPFHVSFRVTWSGLVRSVNRLTICSNGFWYEKINIEMRSEHNECISVFRNWWLLLFHCVLCIRGLPITNHNQLRQSKVNIFISTFPQTLYIRWLPLNDNTPGDHQWSHKDTLDIYRTVIIHWTEMGVIYSLSCFKARSIINSIRVMVTTMRKCTHRHALSHVMNKKINNLKLKVDFGQSSPSVIQTKCRLNCPQF